MKETITFPRQHPRGTVFIHMPTNRVVTVTHYVYDRGPSTQALVVPGSAEYGPGSVEGPAELVPYNSLYEDKYRQPKKLEPKRRVPMFQVIGVFIGVMFVLIVVDGFFPGTITQFLPK